MESSPLHSGDRRNLMAYGHDDCCGLWKLLSDLSPGGRRVMAESEETTQPGLRYCLPQCDKLPDWRPELLVRYEPSFTARFRVFVWVAVTSSCRAASVHFLVDTSSFTWQQRRDACETPDQFWLRLQRSQT